MGSTSMNATALPTSRTSTSLPPSADTSMSVCLSLLRLLLRNRVSHALWVATLTTPDCPRVPLNGLWPVEFLLGLDVSLYLDASDGDGLTAVAWACISGDREMFDVLMAAGANLSLRDIYGGSLVHCPFSLSLLCAVCWVCVLGVCVCAGCVCVCVCVCLSWSFYLPLCLSNCCRFCGDVCSPLPSSSLASSSFIAFSSSFPVFMCCGI